METIVLIFFWLVIALIMGVLGQKKTCGFAGPFIISMLLTPIIALIVVIAAKPLPTEEQRMAAPSTQVDQLEKLARLKDQGAITADEYNAQKKKLLT